MYFSAVAPMNQVFLDLLLPLGLGVFVAALSVLLTYFGARKRGQNMDRRLVQKLAMCGVFGLVCGYAFMRMTINNNPELFHGKRENPTRSAGPERPPRSPEQQAEIRALQKAREEQMTAEREARLALRQAARGDVPAAQATELSRKQKDMQHLNSLDIAQLVEVVKVRRQAKDEATKKMRELHAKDSTATKEERRAASERFSLAVGDFMAASKALTQKRIEHSGQRR
ncbi:MAG: hypothetical protein ACO3SO_02555 [Luteolibacter sp.]